ncbi:putative signal peptide protein [Puccinia sorghi]|uniref:Putative signal peptide protein n=1 Tax=Puccinia sorghi TaxID=27349 RepID=A0A0L6V080_9BASI|nr:putative signal peptide protein [Puccinia sorghi]
MIITHISYALLLSIHQFLNPTSTFSITPENPNHRILMKQTQIYQTINICSEAWLSTDLMLQFMILLQAWKANQISFESQSSIFPPWKMSHSHCHSSPSLSSNIPRKPLFLQLESYLHPSAQLSVQNHNMLYIIKLNPTLGYFSMHWFDMLSKWHQDKSQPRQSSQKIRLNLSTTYDQHTTGISSVYGQFKRKQLHASSMETELVWRWESYTTKMRRRIWLFLKIHSEGKNFQRGKEDSVQSKQFLVVSKIKNGEKDSMIISGNKSQKIIFSIYGTRDMGSCSKMREIKVKLWERCTHMKTEWKERRLPNNEFGDIVICFSCVICPLLVGEIAVYTQPMKARHSSNQMQPCILKFDFHAKELGLLSQLSSYSTRNNPSSSLNQILIYSNTSIYCLGPVLLSFFFLFPQSINILSLTNIKVISYTSSNLFLGLELVILKPDPRYLLQTSPFALCPAKSPLVCWVGFLPPLSHCSFLWQCNILHLEKDHRVQPNILWIPTSNVDSNIPPLIFEFPSSQSQARFEIVVIYGQTLPTEQAALASDSDNSARHEAFSQTPSNPQTNCKKVLYAALYLGGRASQWFEPNLDLLENQSPSCLINIKLFIHEGQRLGIDLPRPVPDSPVKSQLERCPLCFPFPKRVQTIELDNCYHEKIMSSKKAESTPSTSKNEDVSSYKKKFPSKPSIPSALPLAPRAKKSTKIALVLNKEGQINSKEHARRRDFVFIVVSLETCKESYKLFMLQECKITNDVPSSRFILFNSLNQPYRVLLDSEFFKRTQLLVFEEDKVDFSFFQFSQLQMGSNSLGFPWDGRHLPDSVIQLDNTFPPGNLQYPDSSPSSLSSSDHGFIAYCSNPTFFKERAEPSVKASKMMNILKTWKPLKRLFSPSTMIMLTFFPWFNLTSPPHWPYDHQITYSNILIGLEISASLIAFWLGSTLCLIRMTQRMTLFSLEAGIFQALRLHCGKCS